jgi:hypothetical protein
MTECQIYKNGLISVSNRFYDRKQKKLELIALNYRLKRFKQKTQAASNRAAARRVLPALEGT